MKRARDPLTGTPRYPCSAGHRHIVKARAEACEDKPSAKRSARTLFADREPTKARARAERLVRRILAAVPDEALAFTVWRTLLEGWLAGAEMDESAHAYELGALMALEVVAGLPGSDRRVILAELRAIADEAAARSSDVGVVASLEKRAALLFDALTHAGSGVGASARVAPSIPTTPGPAFSPEAKAKILRKAEDVEASVVLLRGRAEEAERQVAGMNAQCEAQAERARRAEAAGRDARAAAWRDAITEAHKAAREAEGKGTGRDPNVGLGAWHVVNHLRKVAPL